MQRNQELVCDGCGQIAPPEHVARRLQRLEWATRYRPVHIGTLLLGAAAPRDDAEFFYSPQGAFEGEAALLAGVAALAPQERSKEPLHVAFQRRGFFATHVLECPFEDSSDAARADLLAKRLPGAIARIRRSLRPRTLVLIAAMLEPFVSQLTAQLTDSRMILNEGKAFRLDNINGGDRAKETMLLRKALATHASEPA
jgi:hypothetical protein